MTKTDRLFEKKSFLVYSSAVSVRNTDNGSETGAPHSLLCLAGSPVSSLHPGVHGQQLAARPSAHPARRGQVPAHPEVCPLQEPRRGVRAQRPQALLPLEGLYVRQVHPDRREAAGDGGAGGAAAAAGAGRERSPGAAAALRHGRGTRPGRRQRHYPPTAQLRGVRLCQQREQLR